MKYSALGSVYYGESPENLTAALSSLKNQTIQPSEVVLVIDGPISKNLEATIYSYVEHLNLKVITLKSNVGLASALNEGLLHCENEIVLRFDTDDVSLPLRAEIQLSFLENNSDVAVLGGQVVEMDQNLSITISTRSVPCFSGRVTMALAFQNPINHPSVAFRRSKILAVGGYPKIYPEDYLLWIRIRSNGLLLLNVPEVLVHMRCGKSFFKRRGYRFLIGEIKTALEFCWRFPLLAPFAILGLTLRIPLRLLPGKSRIAVYRTVRFFQRYL